MTARSIISILIVSFVLSLGLPASAQTVQQLRAQADALETQRRESQKLTGRIKQDYKQIVDNDALPWDLLEHFLPSYEAALNAGKHLRGRNPYTRPLLDERSQLIGGWSFDLAGHRWTKSSSIQSYFNRLYPAAGPGLVFIDSKERQEIAVAMWRARQLQSRILKTLRDEIERRERAEARLLDQELAIRNRVSGGPSGWSGSGRYTFKKVASGTWHWKSRNCTLTKYSVQHFGSQQSLNARLAKIKEAWDASNKICSVKGCDRGAGYSRYWWPKSWSVSVSGPEQSSSLRPKDKSDCTGSIGGPAYSP